MDLETVGVVGAGLMGHGIALQSALSGHRTILVDTTDDNLERAAAHIRTPLGLAPEPERCRGCYSVLWTGITDEKGPSGAFRPICQAVIRNVNE